jgi:hypothetical protein
MSLAGNGHLYFALTGGPAESGVHASCQPDRCRAGRQSSGRRNFELGIVSDDERAIDEVQALYDTIWRGGECAGSKLRDEECEAPLCDAVTSQARAG